MQIPVRDERGNIRMLNVLEESVYVQVDRNGGLVFHTEKEDLSLIRRMEEWTSLLEEAEFLRVDRGTIVNLKKDWLYDSELRVLKIDSQYRSIHIPVAEKTDSKLKKNRLGRVK